MPASPARPAPRRGGQHACACGGGCPRCQAPPIVHEVLRSPGEPLERKDERFADVRVHADPLARSSAAAVNAQAYAVGEHVVLGANSPALLRHELGHTLQQPRIGRSPPADLPIGAADALEERDADAAAPRAHEARPVLRRATITRSCGTFRGACPADSAEEADSREAYERVQQTAAGQWLFEQLQNLPGLESTTIDAHFADNVVHEESGVMGQFHPAISGASAYTALVDLSSHQALGTAQPAAADSPLPAPSTTPYGGAGAEVQTYVVERPSLLAETLFHELLHIWFINTIGTLPLTDPEGAEYGTSVSEPTGHMNAARGEIDSRFLAGLRRFAVQIYRVESDPERLRRAAEARAAREAPPPPPRTLEDLDDGPSPEADAEPAPVTFTAGVRAGLGEAPVAGDPFDVPLEAHAGLLFGRAYQFGVRGEAVWFPDQGLVGVGGSLGFNVLQTESAPGGRSRIATNPWFFDFEAGAAYLIDAPDPLLLRGGLGFGMEHGGPDEWRVFWRVGAALELNPTEEMWNVGGAGNFTLGVRR